MSRLGDLYKAMEILRKEALSLNEELHKVFTSSLIVVPKKISWTKLTRLLTWAVKLR